MMGLFNKKDCIQKVDFSPKPSGGNRFRYPEDKNIILDDKTGYTLFDDKLKYPQEFKKPFDVHIYTNEIDFDFKVYGHPSICNDINNRTHTIKYRWNNADIIGVIQLLAFCSKDDRRVILPSGIHDYMLEHKKEVYDRIKQKYPDYTPEKYRWLTSDIFRFLCVSQGMNPLHAKMMANAVDIFQKTIIHKEWLCLYV